MAATSEARALPYFTDTLGQPLESGSIYIGQPGLDPVAYPAVVTSDIAGTTVVAQPIRTTHGHAVAAGSLIHLFVQIPYSISILDAAGRIVYASLNETDPVAVAIGSSSVQSAGNYTELRARSGSSTNQVWVDGGGMYVYFPTDNTSPENIPFVIVGNDGSRYHLSFQYVNANNVRVSFPCAPNSQGGWFSWNDDGSGSAFLTNNSGLGNGGVVIRTVSPNGLTVLGSVAISSAGTLSATGHVTAAGHIQASTDLIANGNVTAQSGTVFLSADGTKSLSWNGSAYLLAGGPLTVNGSNALTQANFQAAILANQLANGIGAVALGTVGSPSPSQPGTWSQTGTASNSVYLWVRTA